jgi:hypothetical protein
MVKHGNHNDRDRDGKLPDRSIPAKGRRKPLEEFRRPRNVKRAERKVGINVSRRWNYERAGRARSRR